MTNIELIKKLYESFRTKNYEAFEAISAPDLVWIQNAGFPNGGEHHGAAAVVENVFKRFSTEWESFRFEIEQYLDAGDTVIVVGFYEGKHAGTGRSFRSAAAHLYDVRHGKVFRFRQFADTHLIRAAMD